MNVCHQARLSWRVGESWVSLTSRNPKPCSIPNLEDGSVTQHACSAIWQFVLPSWECLLQCCNTSFHAGCDMSSDFFWLAWASKPQTSNPDERRLVVTCLDFAWSCAHSHVRGLYKNSPDLRPLLTKNVRTYGTPYGLMATSLQRSFQIVSQIIECLCKSACLQTAKDSRSLETLMQP